MCWMWEKLVEMQRRYKHENLSLVRGYTVTQKWNLSSNSR